MLTGWVCLYLFLVYVLTHGGKIQGWHAAIWVVATFVGTVLVQGSKGSRVQGHKDTGVQGCNGLRVEGEEGEVGQGHKGGKVQGLKGLRLEGGEGEVVQGLKGLGLKGEEKVESEKRKAEKGEPSVNANTLLPFASRLPRLFAVSGVLTLVGVALPIFFSWVLSHFTDFSWDGLTTRGITVRNLMKGDPALNTYPFGHVLAGFLAHVTGSWQGGKGINLTLIWICFCFVFPALQSLNFSGGKLWFLSVVTALNPVAVYQISCFQIDGHVASLVTCLIFSMVRMLASGPIRPDGVLALVTAFTASAACKTSGVFYAIIIDGIFLLFLAGTSRSWKRVLLLLGVAVAVSWPLGVYIRSIGQFVPLSWDYLKTSGSIHNPGQGVGGGASAVQELGKFDKVQQFFASSFAMTESLPDQLRIKPPFWMTRRELRVFEDLTPDPRAGGFGPQYGTAVLLAGSACLILFFLKRQFYWPGWFVFLTTFGSSLGSQIWWARWTPQNWLLLVAMLMAVLAYGFKGGRVQGWKEEEPEGEKVQKFKGAKVGRLEDGEEGFKAGRMQGFEGVLEMGVKGLGGLACIAAGVNVFLVTLYYLVGMQRQETVLHKQIELAGRISSPVPLYVGVSVDAHNAGASFIGSEYWLTDRGIQVERLSEPPPKPRMKLNKTATLFPLPPDWRLLLQNPKDEEMFRKRNCVEE